MAHSPRFLAKPDTPGQLAALHGIQTTCPTAPRASGYTHLIAGLPASAGAYVTDRFKLGLLSPNGVESEQRWRRRIRGSLTRFLERRLRRPGGFGQTSEILVALVAFLRSGPAEVVLLNPEDLWLETQPQNVPGTTCERVNWQRKTRFPIEFWARLSAIRRMPRIIHPTQ